MHPSVTYLSLFSFLSVSLVILKLFLLRHLWKSLLDLRPTSNDNLINIFIMIEVLFIEETTKITCIINMCGLTYFYKFCRILEEFVKLQAPLASRFFMVDIWL